MTKIWQVDAEMGRQSPFRRAAFVGAAAVAAFLALSPAASAQVLGVPVPVTVPVPPVTLAPVPTVSIPGVTVAPGPVVPGPVAVTPSAGFGSGGVGVDLEGQAGPVTVDAGVRAGLPPIPGSALPLDPVTTGDFPSVTAGPVAPQAPGSPFTGDPAPSGFTAPATGALPWGPNLLTEIARSGADAERPVETTGAGVTGALEHPGTTGRWASLGSAAGRLAPWLALLAVAIVVQAIVRSAWRDRLRAVPR